MSGETANKAQGHLDAVNRAKNERLDRHTGECDGHKRDDWHVHTAAVTVQAEWPRCSSSEAVVALYFYADHHMSFSHEQSSTACSHAPAGTGVRGSPKKGELDAVATLNVTMLLRRERAHVHVAFLWLMCHGF